MRPLVLLCLASHAFAVPLDEPKLSRLLGFSGKVVDVSPPTLPQTPLPFRLLGTLRSKDGAWSLAALECGSKSTTVSIGDVVLGVEIVTIDQQELTVRREGRLERLGRAAPTASRPSEVPRVSRKQVDDAVRDPRQLLREVQLLPAMNGGRLTGFRASFVKEGSMVSSLGLKTGDVLKSVNGVTLDRPDQLLVLYSTLQTTRRFDVELERDGVRVTKSVELDP